MRFAMGGLRRCLLWWVVLGLFSIMFRVQPVARADDMTLTGFHHGALNYLELAGASLLCVSPLAALRASRSTGR